MAQMYYIVLDLHVNSLRLFRSVSAPRCSTYHIDRMRIKSSFTFLLPFSEKQKNQILY